MHTQKPVAAYQLDGQIELLVHSRTNQILRTVSFDSGDRWLEWVVMTNHRTNRPVGFAATPDGRRKWLAYRKPSPHDGTSLEPVLGSHDLYVLQKTRRFGFDWSPQPLVIGPEQFNPGPALVCSPDGDVLHLFGFSLDARMRWWTMKESGEPDWMRRHQQLGGREFKSEAAAVMSADGLTILVFGIGKDDRCLYARTDNGGRTWPTLWEPLGAKTFTSGPAACISADGRQVIIAARAEGRRFFCNRSANGGATWRGWEAIRDGVFLGGPALCAAWDFSRVFVFGVGDDHKIWKAHAAGPSGAFAGWSPADRHNKLTAI
jgi:hypothetical protein